MGGCAVVSAEVKKNLIRNGRAVESPWESGQGRWTKRPFQGGRLPGTLK